MYRESRLIGLAHVSEYPVTATKGKASKIYCQDQMLDGSFLEYYKIFVLCFFND